MSCAQYLDPFLTKAGGYLTNPNDTTLCNFCGIANTDEFLASRFNMFYNHAWRDFGLMMAYVAYNVRPTLSYNFLGH